MYQNFQAELDWATLHMTRTRDALAALPDLSGVRLACNMHLDLKMAPLVAGLLDKGLSLIHISEPTRPY